MAKAKGGWKTGGDQGKAKGTTASIGVLSGNLTMKKPRIAKSTIQPSRQKAKGK